jgi:hypothetical protein
VAVATAGELGVADLVVAAEAGTETAASMAMLKAAAPIRAKVRRRFPPACGAHGELDILDIKLHSILFV